jgi:hypothetical protein
VSIAGGRTNLLLEGCWRAFEGQYFNNWEPNRPGKPMVIARQLIQDDQWWTFWTGTDYGFPRASAIPNFQIARMSLS